MKLNLSQLTWVPRESVPVTYFNVYQVIKHEGREYQEIFNPEVGYYILDVSKNLVARPALIDATGPIEVENVPAPIEVKEVEAPVVDPTPVPEVVQPEAVAEQPVVVDPAPVAPKKDKKAKAN